MKLKAGDLVMCAVPGSPTGPGIGTVVASSCNGGAYGAALVSWSEWPTLAQPVYEWVKNLALVHIANPHTDVTHLEKQRPTNGQRVVADWLLDRSRPRAARAVLVKKVGTKPLPIRTLRFHTGGFVERESQFSANMRRMSESISQFSESAVRMVREMREGAARAPGRHELGDRPTTARSAEATVRAAEDFGRGIDETRDALRSIASPTEYASNVGGEARQSRRTWPKGRREWWHR